MQAVLDALEARYPMLRGTIRDAHQPAAAAVREVLYLRAGSLARPVVVGAMAGA
jgi:hypothetical protein